MLSKMNWDIFSKNRAHMMGFAIILIMAFHWAENYTLLTDSPPAILDPLVEVGSCGVEIFLFLSGIGLYFSYTRTRNLKSFYLKRLVTILVPYLILAAPYLLWQDFIYQQNGIKTFLADLTMLTAFQSSNRQCWYVALILLLYLVFPLFYRFLERQSTVRFILLEAIFMALPVALQIYNLELFSLAQIALTRVPTFIMGIYCGRLVYEKKPLRWFPVLMAVSFVAFKAIDFYGKSAGLRTTVAIRYWRAALMLLIMVLITLLLDRFPLPRIKALLNAAAPMTLELYLAHVEVRRIFPRIFHNCWNFSAVTLAYISIIAISVPIAWYVHQKAGKISSSLLRRLQKS